MDNTENKDVTVEKNDEVKEEKKTEETKEEGSTDGEKETKKEETKTPEINIDEIVSKALDKKEKAMLKSIFKQQGVADEDIEAKIAEYKKAQEGTLEDKLAKKDEEIKQAIEAAEKAKDAIKAAAVKTAILGAGIPAKKADIFAKLIDLTAVKVNDDLTVDVEAIKKQINKILEDVPEFKETKTEQGIKFGVQKQIDASDNGKKSYSLRDGVKATITR